MDASPWCVAMHYTASGSSTDIPVAALITTGVSTGSADLVGNRTVPQLSFSEGPNIIVLVIGDPHGRWRNQCLRTRSAPCARFQACLRSHGIDGIADEASPTPVIVGFALMQAWKFMQHGPSDCQAATMCQCQEGIRASECSVAYLEHRVIAGAELVLPVPLQPGSAWKFNKNLCRELILQALHVPLLVRDPQQHVLAEVNFVELQNRWKHMLDTPQQTQAFIWPLWTPLAKAIVCRKWSVDVTTLLFRDFKQRWRPPLLPPRFAVLAFLREARLHKVQTHCNAVEGQAVECIPSVVRRGYEDSVAPRMFSSQFVIAALRASCRSRAVRDALTKEQLQTYAVLMQTRWPAVEVPLGIHLPGYNTLRKARTRLDICAMLANRAIAKHTQCFRYLAFDASPQKRGRAIICTMEHVIPCSAIADNIRAEDVVIRRLPICALGQGRFSLVDKVACLVHQMWLDYGPSVNDVIRANHEVRQCLSDMGTEFGICEYPDVVRDVLIGAEIHCVLKTTTAATTPAFPLQKLVFVSFGFGGSRDTAYYRLGPQAISELCPRVSFVESKCQGLDAAHAFPESKGAIAILPH